MVIALSAAVVALAFPGCEPEPDRDQVLLDDFVAFATDPSDETWASVPFADRVQLGLGERLLETHTAHELRDPVAWFLDVDHFRGRVGRPGMFSSLAVLRPMIVFQTTDPPVRVNGLEYGEGSHRRCASPPRPPPRAVLGLRRLSIQPQEPASCLRWFAVDVFVDESGDIRAVTLDLWEP